MMKYSPRFVWEHQQFCAKLALQEIITRGLVYTKATPVTHLSSELQINFLEHDKSNPRPMVQIQEGMRYRNGFRTQIPQRKKHRSSSSTSSLHHDDAAPHPSGSDDVFWWSYRAARGLRTDREGLRVLGEAGFR